MKTVNIRLKTEMQTEPLRMKNKTYSGETSGKLISYGFLPLKPLSDARTKRILENKLIRIEPIRYSEALNTEKFQTIKVRRLQVPPPRSSSLIRRRTVIGTRTSNITQTDLSDKENSQSEYPI